MVKRVFGKVDGIEVNYDHSKGDWWNVPVPLDIDGEYVIEVIAEDEAGNQSFITRLLYTVKGENICVHQLPLSGHLFEKLKGKYASIGCTQNVRRYKDDNFHIRRGQTCKVFCSFNRSI